MAERPSHRPLSQALLLVLPLLASACTPQEGLWDPADTPKAVAVERMERTAVLPANRDGLSAADAAQLRRMIDDLGAPQRTRVTVSLPAGADRRKAAPIVRTLSGLGVAPVNIVVAQQVAGSASAGGIAVTAEVYAAIPPRCPDWQRPNLDDGTFRSSSNLGCPNANNLAYMLADPGDLVAPRRLGPAAGAVQEEAVTRYLTDKVTPLRNAYSTTGGSNGSGGSGGSMQ